MTIKQNGGIFGRNPEFNDVSAKDVSVTDEITILENGVDVGGVRSLSGQAQLSGTTTGITFGAQSVLPTNGGSAIQNGTRDIGGASNFWRNMYVSTGVYFGSQTTATHLDDYEEGVYTPTLTPAGSGSSGTITLNSTYDKLAYTKIGRLVTVTGTVIVSSVSSPAGTRVDISLPFTGGDTSDISERCCGLVLPKSLGSVGNAAIRINGPSATVGSLVTVSSGTQSDIAATDFSGNEELQFTFSYIAA
jgi:hypothetical protein